MRILHLCLANYYIDGYNYNENVLPRINKQDGHEVLIIASTETFVENTKLGYVHPGEYYTDSNIKIIRLPYVSLGSKYMSAKIRAYHKLYDNIAIFKPDIIMSHDLCFLSVLDVIKYLKRHPEVNFYADTHTARYNSGLNWLSLYVLHRLFYKSLIQRALPYLKKYFYIGESEKKFSIENYKVPESLMEYFPLGGMIFADEHYENIREKRRKELHIEDDELLLLHSGKMDVRKKTAELVNAFSSTLELKARLVIIGSIPEENRSLYELIESDSRIEYLGWKNAFELQEYLCAADLYCQPGSVSATLQNAICCRCAILSYPYEEYTSHLDFGQFLWASNQKEIIAQFRKILFKRISLHSLGEKASQCAAEVLDYRKIAAKLYES